MTWLPEDFKGLEKCNVDMKNSIFLNVVAALQGNFRIKSDDLTFIIPYGTDSQNRFENLCDVLIWITANTTAKIHIYISENRKKLSEFKWFGLDDDSNLKKILYNNICIHRLHKNDFKDQLDYEEYFEYFSSKVKITLKERPDDEPFHRTKYLNEMLAEVDTPFVVNHDADVFLPRHALITALIYLRKSNVDVVYPYDYGKSQIQIFERTGPDSINVETALLLGDTAELVSRAGNGMMIWNAKYGQTIFFKTKSYISMFGENENFVSWAPEDVERYVRASKMGLNIARIKGKVFHLEHPRGSDSSTSNPMFIKNEQLWDKLQKMDKDELIDYYKNSDYVKKYDWV